ncbi:MAG: hypothetical protein Q8R08_02885 [bacterium]|nr:hypothetical protein [bacterium]
MFRVIHPNRWFIWTLVFLLAASFLVMFWIQSYLLEIEREAYEGQNLIRGWKTYSSSELGISVRYPEAWQVEIDRELPHYFALVNPNDFNENISFNVTKPELENVIRSSLKIAAEERVTIDNLEGRFLKGLDSLDIATSNIILIKKGDKLYQIAGDSKNFEKIAKSVRFITPSNSPLP